MNSEKLLSVFWHSVERDDFSPDRLHPTESLFKKHLKFLLANYTPISILDFLQLREHKRSISYTKRPVLLGFDDGFKNIMRLALPILEEFRVPAVFFVIGNILRNPCFVPWHIEVRHVIRRTTKKTLIYRGATLNLTELENVVRLKGRFAASFLACRSDVDRQALLQNFADSLGVARPVADDLDEDLRFVNKADLANLPSSSLLTVASHAMTHRDLATLPYKEQVEELELSDLLLREYCASYYPVVAYPNGSFNLETINIASRIYKAGFAVFLGASYRNLYAYPRIGIENHSVKEVAYAISLKRRKYILPIKRFLYLSGIRPL